MKLQAAARLMAAQEMEIDAAGRGQEWFDGLGKKQQKEYLEQHPSSKYGKKAGSSGAGHAMYKTPKAPAKQKHDDEIAGISSQILKLERQAKALKKAGKPTTAVDKQLKELEGKRESLRQAQNKKAPAKAPTKEQELKKAAADASRASKEAHAEIAKAEKTGDKEAIKKAKRTWALASKKSAAAQDALHKHQTAPAKAKARSAIDDHHDRMEKASQAFNKAKDQAGRTEALKQFQGELKKTIDNPNTPPELKRVATLELKWQKLQEVARKADQDDDEEAFYKADQEGQKVVKLIRQAKKALGIH